MADIKQKARKLYVVYCDANENCGRLPAIIHLEPNIANKLKRQKVVIEQEEGCCSPFMCLVSIIGSFSCQLAELAECDSEPSWFTRSSLPHLSERVEKLIADALRNGLSEESDDEQA